MTMRPGVHPARHDALTWRQSAAACLSRASSAVSACFTFSTRAPKLTSWPAVAVGICILEACISSEAALLSWRAWLGRRDVDAEAFLDRLTTGGVRDLFRGRFGRTAGPGFGHEAGQLANPESRQLPACRLHPGVFEITHSHPAGDGGDHQ